jgi:hypothetical protein
MASSSQLYIAKLVLTQARPIDNPMGDGYQRRQAA